MSPALRRILFFCLALLSAGAAVGSYYVDPQQLLFSWNICFAAMVFWVLLAAVFCLWAMRSSYQQS